MDIATAREYIGNAQDELGHEPDGLRFRERATKAQLRAAMGRAYSWCEQTKGLLAEDAPPSEESPEEGSEGSSPEVPPGRYHVQWGGDGQQSFDVHIPAVLQGAPILVLVPGGGWQMDAPTPSDLVPWLQRYGIVVEVNYRLQSGADCVHDVAAAIRLASEHASRWGGAADRLHLLGHSAGGWAVWAAALDPGWGCPAPASVVSLAGALFPGNGPAGAPPTTQQLIEDAFEWDYPRFAPESHLDDRGHPLRGVVVHGSADDQIPPVWAQRFVRAATDRGHDVRLHLVPGGSHFLNPATDGRVAQAVEWAVRS